MEEIRQGKSEGIQGSGWDSSGSGEGPVVGSCGHDTETLDSIQKTGNFLTNWTTYSKFRKILYCKEVAVTVIVILMMMMMTVVMVVVVVVVVVVVIIIVIISGDDDDTNDDNNGDIRCEAFTIAAEGIKSPQVASCGNLEQTPLFWNPVPPSRRKDVIPYSPFIPWWRQGMTSISWWRRQRNGSFTL